MTNRGKSGEGRNRHLERVQRGVMAAVLLVPIAIGLPSIFFPLTFADAVGRLCEQVEFLCVPSSFYNEAVRLASMGYADYGIGLEAFRRLGVALTLLGAAVLLVAHFATGRGRQRLAAPRFIPAIEPLDIPVGIAGLGFVVWWSLFSPDIYLGGRNFVTVGPPMGTVGYAAGIGFSSIAVTLGVIYALRYTLLKRAFPPAGSTPSDER